MMRRAMTVVAAIAMAACGSGEPDREADRETVFDPLVDTLEEAEAINDVALEQKARMDEALREMEGEEDEEPDRQ